MSRITNFQRTERVRVARNVQAECVRQGHAPVRFIAETLGLHVSTVRRKNKGDVAYDTDELAALAAALNVDAAAFFAEIPAEAAADPLPRAA